MPYIKQENRPNMNNVVDEMVAQGVKVNGDLNYILFKFCKNNVIPGYGNYSIGVQILISPPELIR